MIQQNRIDLWFAQEFNPIWNNPASNPLKIFEQLDSASKKRERNPKARLVERNLLKWTRDMSRRGAIEETTLIEATRAIAGALELGEFGLVVLQLRGIESAERMGEFDEFRVSGQSLSDSDHVRQVLPPID